MKEKIINAFFSLSGASISIGVLGFLASVVTIFIDVNSQVSTKILLLSIYVTITLSLILLKIIYDLSHEIKPPPPFEHPIRYVPDEGVFVIKRNEIFLNSIVVGCYAQIDEIERLAYIGVVHIVQDKVIQIKVLVDCKKLSDIPVTPENLKKIVIRPVMPISAISQLNNLESSYE